MPVTTDGNATASDHGLWDSTPLNRRGRMNGIVVVDKPAAITSAQVVARVKALLKVKKVGHTGTLDPFATGVLVCCINQATRLARFLMAGRKRYEAVMRLGVRTDTQDLTGQVVSQDPDVRVDHDKVRSVFRDFLKIKEQVPPAFSALKHRGVPLYKLARGGAFVKKPARPISLYELEVLDIDLPHVHFMVSCSQGTYVRTLCADMGDVIGCGAHLVQLCRTESGGFTLEEAISLRALKEVTLAGQVAHYVTPMSRALRAMPELHAGPALTQRIRSGQPIVRADLEPIKDPAPTWIKVTDHEGHLIAVISANEKKGVYPYACVFPKQGL
ncbi:MAG: tRNA pseudouridine(55) synthase TruB [Thermodesulfobacteriota bacterium]|nr:tRNA pseudouridine(55) synthase TruB [Thermodesulfobacteriota bacterium]